MLPRKMDYMVMMLLISIGEIKEDSFLKKLALKYAERYNPKYGTGLVSESATLVEDIAHFWQQYYCISGSDSLLNT